LIKGSKDSDSSLVSNENFSEKLWPSCWALSRATWAKMAQKLLYLWCLSQKIHNPQPKNFFRVQSRRLSDLFEPLNRSLAQCFSTPSPRTQMSPRKALAESTSTMGKQACCNALRQYKLCCFTSHLYFWGSVVSSLSLKLLSKVQFVFIVFFYNC